MPTVLRSGPYRVFFFSSDREEPQHVHIERGSSRAKFWLNPVRLGESGGFNRPELKRIEVLIAANESSLMEAWNEFFSR